MKACRCKYYDKVASSADQISAVMRTDERILDEIGEVAVVDTADIEKDLWQKVRKLNA